MRLFAGIEIPGAVRKKIWEQLSDMRKEYPSWNWLPIENYHITVHYFGEVSDIKPIASMLDERLYDQEPFYMYSSEVEMFMRDKIVVYLNFLREKKLEILKKKIEPDQSRFIPHLTVARCRIPSKQQYLVLKKRLKSVDLDVTFKVSRLVLFESILTSPYPKYIKRESYRFAEPI